MKFSDKLRDMNACPEAVEWVGRRGIKTAWRDCKRGDWMLWLAEQLNIDRKLLVLAACDCAETALQYVPDGEDRPAKAIQAARNWCNGTASLQEVLDAADAAAAAAAYAAAYAAYVAAYAGYAAAYAADAADAAAAAAAVRAARAAAAVRAARAATRKNCANLVRKRIPVEIIEAALRKVVELT